MNLGPWTLPSPYEWQIEEDRLHGDEPRRGIFASPRLGKTNQVALSLRRRAGLGLWAKALVVAPLKVCPIWDEVLRSAGLPVHRIYEDSVRKIERELRAPWEGVCIVNQDKLIHVVEPVGKIDVFIADESHHFAAVSSGRAKAYRRLARTTPYVRALTGTPVPRHFGSLWSQLCAMDPDRWGTSYEKFAQRFLIRDAMFRSRVLQHINVDELQSMINAVASVYRREDIFGPDSFQFIHRHVEMPERAWMLYHKLAREWILDDPQFASAVEAKNAGVRLMRLQQLTSGFTPGGENGLPFPIHQAKIDMMIEDLEEIVQSDEKLAIYHRFTFEGDTAYAEIKRLFPTVSIFKIDGKSGASPKENKRRMDEFNAHEGSAVIVVQIQSGSEGISLKTAQNIGYLSRDFSFVNDEQSRDRVFDIGMPRVVTYYEVPGTVDDFTNDLLASRRDIHEAIRNVDREALVYGNIRRKGRKNDQ